MVDEQYWDENKALEWVVRGFKKLNINAKYETKVAILPVIAHKAQMPSEARFINHMAYKQGISYSDVDYIKRLMGNDSINGFTTNVDDFTFPDTLAAEVIESFYQRYANIWQPITPSMNPYTRSVHLETPLPAYFNPTQDETYNMVQCEVSYDIHPNGCITTTFKEGFLFLSYSAYATDDGELLIPDDANLKDALFHFFMYRYHEAKAVKHTQNSANERAWHLHRYSILGRKASAQLNAPDIPTLENIKNITNRMIKTTSDYGRFFTGSNQTQTPNL